jgi:hypothetical protein
VQNILVLFFPFLMILATSGCASSGSVSIDDLNTSLVDLQRVVTDALPLGKRKQSQNTRVFYSSYFLVKKGEYEAAADHPYRNYAEIFILGDRRPYKIEVRVITEKRERDGEYSLIKYDEGLARVISRRIQMALHKRREDRNIIDDFRVF